MTAMIHWTPSMDGSRTFPDPGARGLARPRGGQLRGPAGREEPSFLVGARNSRPHTVRCRNRATATTRQDPLCWSALRRARRRLPRAAVTPPRTRAHPGNTRARAGAVRRTRRRGACSLKHLWSCCNSEPARTAVSSGERDCRSWRTVGRGGAWSGACAPAGERAVRGRGAFRAARVAAGEIGDTARRQRCRVAAQCLVGRGGPTRRRSPWPSCHESESGGEIRPSSVSLGDLPRATRIPEAVRAARRRAMRSLRFAHAHRRICALAHALAAAGDGEAPAAAAAAGMSLARRDHLRSSNCGCDRARGDWPRRWTRGPKGQAAATLLREDLRCASRARSLRIRFVIAGGEKGELERFLELAHAAADDRGAIDQVCARALEILGARSVVVVGRGPRSGRSESPGAVARRTVVSRVLAGESHVAVDLRGAVSRGQPVACAGELVAAIACRYAAAPGAQSRTAQC